MIMVLCVYLDRVIQMSTKIVEIDVLCGFILTMPTLWRSLKCGLLLHF